MSILPISQHSERVRLGCFVSMRTVVMVVACTILVDLLLPVPAHASECIDYSKYMRWVGGVGGVLGLAGSYAYMTEGEVGVEIADRSDPESPAIVGARHAGLGLGHRRRQPARLRR